MVLPAVMLVLLALLALLAPSPLPLLPSEAEANGMLPNWARALLASRLLLLYSSCHRYSRQAHLQALQGRDFVR